MHPALPRTTPGSSPEAALSRRWVLMRGGQGLLALAAIGVLAPACGSDRPTGPDPLESQLAAARSDAALAAAAADAAVGQPAAALVPALRVISDERTRHAAALVEEIARAAGKPIPAADSPGITAAATAAPEPDPPGPPPGVRDVVDALRRSADSAANLVPTLSGYRAGLVGSIAASCTAAHTVGLVPAGRTR